MAKVETICRGLKHRSVFFFILLEWVSLESSAHKLPMLLEHVVLHNRWREY